MGVSHAGTWGPGLGRSSRDELLVAQIPDASVLDPGVGTWGAWVLEAEGSGVYVWGALKGTLGKGEPGHRAGKAGGGPGSRR